MEKRIGRINSFIGFVKCRSGNFAASFALMLPLLFGLVGGAIDFVSYNNQEEYMQNVADAAVLAATKEAGLQGWTPEIAKAVAEKYIADKMAVRANIGSTEIVAKATAATDEKSISVTVEMDHHPFFMMGYFKGSPQISVSATATASGEMNICVIGLDTKMDGAVSLTSFGKIIAPKCAVYSNSTSPDGFASVGAAYLDSDYNCSAGGAAGAMKNYAVMPTTDCKPIDDPLRDRPKPDTSTCDHTNKIVAAKFAAILSPGVYCGGINITALSNVVFKPGIYVIKDGELKSNLGGISFGLGVSFYFTGEGSRFAFDSTTRISFTAPEKGIFAGILFYQDPEMVGTQTYEINSEKAGKLLGTIYLPNGIFKVHALNKVGEESAYTVIVAKQIDVGALAQLVINADYASTKVPVPDGLGPQASIRLSD